MKRLSVCVALIAFSVPFIGVAIAQELPSVMYQGHEIQVEPEKGEVQGCVSRVVTTETLDDTTIATEGFIIANNSGEWIVTGIFTGSPPKDAPGSHLEDCWHLEWDQ